METGSSGETERWFTEKVYPHDAALKAHLRHSFPSVQDLDDVVQESYIRVWRRQALRPIESVKGFLFQVARRLAIDNLRRNQKCSTSTTEDVASTDLPAKSGSPATSLGEKEMHDLLAEAMLKLPARCREIVILRKIKGIPQRAVAESLSLSERTVENQCRIGVKKCEEFLRSRGVNHLYHEGE